MYIGHQWNADGLYFLLVEVMRLAIRPELANLCSKLQVVIEGDTVLSILDDGRGLPIESIQIDQSVERPKIEHVFSWMFTTNPPLAYCKDFGYFNYLGFVLNAVSEQLEVEPYFERQRYTLTCGRGEIVDPLRRISDTPNGKGTRLTFTPDPDIFPELKFEFEDLYTKLSELKRVSLRVQIVLEDKRSTRKVEI